MVQLYCISRNFINHQTQQPQKSTTLPSKNFAAFSHPTAWDLDSGFRSRATWTSNTFPRLGTKLPRFSAESPPDAVRIPDDYMTVRNPTTSMPLTYFANRMETPRPHCLQETKHDTRVNDNYNGNTSFTQEEENTSTHTLVIN